MTITEAAPRVRVPFGRIGEFGRCPMRFRFVSSGVPVPGSPVEASVDEMHAGTVRDVVRSRLVADPSLRTLSPPEDWRGRDVSLFEEGVEALLALEAASEAVRRVMGERVAWHSNGMDVVVGPYMLEDLSDGTLRVVNYTTAAPGTVDHEGEADVSGEAQRCRVRRSIVADNGILDERQYKACVYACALADASGAVVSEVVVRHLRMSGRSSGHAGIAVETLLRFTPLVRRRTIDIFEHQVASFVDAAETGGFRCRVSGQCSSCPYTSMCPAHRPVSDPPTTGA